MVICRERDAKLHVAQLMTLPLSDSCFSEIQIGLTFLVPAHWVVPEKGPLNGCVWSQWRNDGVAAASSDGGPTGGRGPRQFYFVLNQRGGALTYGSGPVVQLMPLHRQTR